MKICNQTKTPCTYCNNLGPCSFEFNIENFQEKYCRLCGTLMCPGDAGAILTCGHFIEIRNKNDINE